MVFEFGGCCIVWCDVIVMCVCCNFLHALG